MSNTNNFTYKQRDSYLETVEELNAYLKRAQLYGTLMPNRDNRRVIYYQYHPTKMESESINFNKRGIVHFRKYRTYIKFTQK